MTTVPRTEAATPPEDPALRFIRLELAPSPQRWIAALGFTGLALIGVLATVTFRIPYPVLVFAGILLLTVPPPYRPFHQAAEVTGAAFLGAGFAILLAVTSYDQPWLYLPMQCAALTVLLVLSRVTAARAAFILAALVLSFAEPAYLPDPQAAIGAALFNALALAGTAWVVAAAQAPFAPPATRDEAPAPPRRGELVGFAMLALSAIGLQMLFYNTINLPEIRTGVIAVLLTADPDLRAVWRRMPLRQLYGASCAVLAFLMIAVGAPLMDDLAFLAVLAGCCYFTSLSTRPDLAARFADVRAREAELERARADYLPKLSANGALGRVYRELDSLNLGPNGTTFYPHRTTGSIGLQLSWELFDGFIRDNRVREAKARRDQARADHDALQLASQAEVWTAYADFQSALSQHQFAVALVATTKSGYDSALTGYGSGITNFVDLLAAERDYARSLAVEVDTRAAILESAATLAFAAGTTAD